MPAKDVVIVDYKIGNKHSIKSAFAHVMDTRDRLSLSHTIRSIQECSHLVFPGVGAFKDCRAALLEAGLLEPIKTHLNKGKPLFGICVGMQLLFTKSSENGTHQGLDICHAPICRLQEDALNGVKIPHVGWNNVEQKAHWLWTDIALAAQFYFTHSYAALMQDAGEYAIGTTCHGTNHFLAAVAHDNIVATQFHPEKSHTNGLQLLRNFLTFS